MSTPRLTTFGGFAFNVNGISTRGPATRKARALMSFLIMHRGVDAARERLLDIFWPDSDPERARGSLKTALWSIRRCLRTAGIEPADFFLINRATVRWTADTSVDALQFGELAAQDDPTASRKALQLYRGDFLEGDYDNWSVTERERLAGLYETVLARVMRTSKDPETAQRFIARNPYDEEAYATLIEAELTAGRRSSAASWVERCRKALSEIGEKPTPAFETQFGNIVRIDPLIADELTLPFAGREAERALLAAKFADAAKGRGSITLVHGEAGIGKSTLLSRAADIAAENGLRVLVVRCAGEVPTTFGPWQQIFGALGAGDLEPFARAHAGDLTTAVAQAITARLIGPTAIIVDDVQELTGQAFDIFVALSLLSISNHAVLAGLRPEGEASLRSRLAEVPFEVLPIGCLQRNDLQWALAQTLGGAQPDVLDVLYKRSGGHPLFFAGLLNSLVTTGALARDGYRWQLIKPIDADTELPGSVRQFIETWLHARGDAPRALAGALALDPVADADDLAAVLRSDEPSVLDALDDLLSLGLIRQPTSGSQFAFTHDLIREVAAAGLNAGRCAALHRAFAQRLMMSRELEASLRRARHLQAAGEPLSAAQSFLKSAQEALELNAVQDTIERCDAGIQAVDNIERSDERAAVLAKLHSTSARAAILGGNADEAVRRAREAVAFARSGGQNDELARAVLELAVIEGAAFQSLEQKSDAAEAAQNAQLCGDDTLEAQALVQQASAARELGLRDEALQACGSAHNIALRCGRSDLAQRALEELLCTQMTWWFFTDAQQTARAGLESARRADRLAEAAFRLLRCALWYLLERFDEAEAELQVATRIMSEAFTRRQGLLVELSHSLPVLQYTGHYMAGKIAAAQKQWDQALEAVEKAAALTNVAKLPRHNEALLLLRIDALLQRNLPGDSETAHALTASLSNSSFTQGILGWSDCVELARARDAARHCLPSAHSLLRRALNTLEENAQRAFLESDRAFARLAEAASEVGEVAVANHAHERYKHYRSRRHVAAGAAWGGKERV